MAKGMRRAADSALLRGRVSTRRSESQIEHSLLQATGDVEAFVAVYAVLQSVLGKQADVDSFTLIEAGSARSSMYGA